MQALCASHAVDPKLIAPADLARREQEARWIIIDCE